MQGEGIDQIGADGHEGSQQAQPYAPRTDDGRDPVGMFLRCPAIDEQTNRYDESPRDHRRQTIFRFHLPVILLAEVSDDPIAREAEDEQAAETPDADTQIGEPDGAGGEVVGGFEDLCDGCEEEVEVAVDDGHEGGEGEDDGGEDEEFEGADDGAFEEFAGGEVDGEFGAEVGVVGFFAEFGGATFEEDGGIGFAEEEEGHDRDCSGLYCTQSVGAI